MCGIIAVSLVSRIRYQHRDWHFYHLSSYLFIALLWLWSGVWFLGVFWTFLQMNPLSVLQLDQKCQWILRVILDWCWQKSSLAEWGFAVHVLCPQGYCKMCGLMGPCCVCLNFSFSILTSFEGVLSLLQEHWVASLFVLEDISQLHLRSTCSVSVLFVPVFNLFAAETPLHGIV